MLRYGFTEISPASPVWRSAAAAVAAGATVEAGAVIGWDRYTGKNGARIGMHSFGSSAPIKDLMKKFADSAKLPY